MIMPFYSPRCRSRPRPCRRPPGSDPDIVVTASLTPIPAAEAPASVTVFDEADDRRARSAARHRPRPPGARRLGRHHGRAGHGDAWCASAAANPTILSSSSTASPSTISPPTMRRASTRFTSGGLGRLELIRGPQSALVGIGGAGRRGRDEQPRSARRLPCRGPGRIWQPRQLARRRPQIASGGERAGLSATAAWARSDGIDIVGGGAGDRDGFENLTLSLKGVARLGAFEIGARRPLHRPRDRVRRHRSLHLRPRRHARTRRAPRPSRCAAGSASAPTPMRHGPRASKSSISTATIATGSARARTTDTFGRRTRYRRPGRSPLRARRRAARADRRGRARGRGFRHARPAVRRRRATATSPAAAPLLSPNGARDWGERLITDVAIRHDDFSRFVDDTTLARQCGPEPRRRLRAARRLWRGHRPAELRRPVRLSRASRSPAIPTSSPSARAASRAGSAGAAAASRLEAVAFSNDLEDEIVEDFSVFPSTVINAAGKSRRRGFELSAEWRPNAETDDRRQLHLSRRARAERRRSARRAGSAPSAPHRQCLSRAGAPVRCQLGGALAYVGRRLDRDFDLFPAPIVSLDAYVLGSLRIAYRILPQLELFARAENAFDADYQDVVGYNTPGRTVHAGLRVTLGRLASRSPRRRREAAPRRVASLNLCTDELVLLLAAPEQIVSVTHLAQQEAETPLWRQARALPRATTAACSRWSRRGPIWSSPWAAARATGSRIAARLGIATLDLPFAQSLGDVAENIARLAAALGRPEAGAALIRRMTALIRSRPPRAARRDLAGRRRPHRAGGRAGGAMDGAGGPAAAARCRATGSRSRPCWPARPPSCCAATIGQGQYSNGQRWLSHPAARRATPGADDRDRRPALDLHGPAADRRDRAAAARGRAMTTRAAILLAARRWRGLFAASLLLPFAPLRALFEQDRGLAAPGADRAAPAARLARAWSMARRWARRAPRSRRCSPTRSPRPISPARPAARRSGAVVTAYLFGFAAPLALVDRLGGRGACSRSACCSRSPGRGPRPRPCCSPAWRSARWPGR